MGSGQSGQSGFGGSSTAEEVSQGVSLVGKHVVVTGANSGIGKETARILAKRGATVYVASRNERLGREAVEEIKKTSGSDLVKFMQLDLASLASVRKFSEEFHALDVPLNILVNNAGVMATPESKTADGFETQFGTNHLGHFLLTMLLLDRLEEGAPSRVVNVSSEFHFRGTGDYSDYNFEKTPYNPWFAYGQSKTANILFSNEFNRRYSSTGITANSLHPGVIATNLMSSYLGNGVLRSIWDNVVALTPMFKSIPQGAATSVYCATSPALEGVGGKYFNNCNEEPARPHARDSEAATKLWELSKRLVGPF
eukprot:TRINITY_DN3948_c1_g1_i1.p1 TRINITY_DN3948_c1_g1~~TRINITY_DN3948_c1_g1_i1.p1  ORF type:complete len:311 (-),score=58.89 TRINITY_DN3948_c1_g1_i1:82-1014(-)